MRNSIKPENSRKRSQSVEVIGDVPKRAKKILQCDVDKIVYDVSQNKKCEKKSVEYLEYLFVNENYGSESTPQSETGKCNCTSWMSYDDIRRIASIEYNIYDIHIFNNNCEKSSKGLAVVSGFNLDSEIAQFKEIFKSQSSDLALRTFIINLRDSHWVTLVLSYQSGVYVGYYVDSLYDEDGEGKERNKIPDNIKEILINRAIYVEDLKIHQYIESNSCGKKALENAKGINDGLRGFFSNQYGIFNDIQLSRDKYFIAREYLIKKLKTNAKKKEEELTAEYPVNTSYQGNEYSKCEIGNRSISIKDEVFPKFYTSTQDSYSGLNRYNHNILAKMRGYFNLLGITYQLHLLMLCFYRTFVTHRKSTSSLAVEKFGLGRFDDVVLYHRNKCICIQIKHICLERYYNSIGYLELFPRGQRKQQEGMFSVKKYFCSFIKMEDISDVKFLLIYTNADLNLTEGLKLKRPKWSSDYFPLKFDIIDMEKEEYKILKHCLCTKGVTEGHGFYQFSSEEATRRKLLHLLDGNNSTKYDGARSIQEMKNIFLDKLIFAVNQPGREELNYIIKIEIDQRCKTNMVPHVFNELQEGMLSYLTCPKGIYITKENAGMFLKQAEESDDIDTIEQDNKYSGEYKKGSGLRNCTPHLIYKLELFMYCLYRMYQRSDGISISAENENVDITSNICFHYENKITYVWTKYGPGGCINYSMLFPGKDEEGIEMFSLNKYFREYIANVDTEIWRVEHLVIYTNMGLDLTREGKFNDVPIKFNSIDIRSHKVLMHYLCTNNRKEEHGFYQFSAVKETRTVLIRLLDSTDFNNDADKLELNKIDFLEKLVFAVNQPDRGKLVSVTKHEIQQHCKRDPNHVLLEYIALHEVALRCLSASKIYCITKKTVIQKFRDIKDNKISASGTRNCDEKKDEFARTIVSNRGLCHFRDFRIFLDSKEGWNMFDVVCRNKAERNVSSMLMPSGIGVISAFRRLYYMLFCKNGDKSDLLKCLLDRGLKLYNISSILHNAGNKAPEAFEELCAILCKKLDDGKTYLEFFVQKKIIENISSMLSGTGNKAGNAIIALYHVLITKLNDEETLLEFILRNNIMKNISSMLHGAGNEVPDALEQLYNVLIMKLGKKETVLEFIVRKNIMKNLSSMLNGAGSRAADTLKALLTLLSTKSDGKISYLEYFVDKNIMTNISSILNGAGQSACEALAGLCRILRTEVEGEMTYIDFFIEKKIMGNISSMLSGAGKRAPEVLEALCAILWKKFSGEMTYLKFFLEKKIMGNLSNMLHGAGKSAPEALERLYAILNTKLNGEMTYLDFFVEKKIIRNISGMLHGAGRGAAEALEAIFIILNSKLDGEMTYLKFFVEKKIMGNISSMLKGAGRSAPKALEALCKILSMKLDGKLTYLEFFVEKKVMGNIATMLSGGRRGISEALKELIFLLDTKLNDESTYLDFYLENNILKDMFSMLKSAGRKSPEALKELHDLLFNKDYLEHFSKEGINLSNLSHILKGTRGRAPSALRNVHSLCFDIEGNKTKYFSELIIANHSRPVLFSLLRKAASIWKCC